MSQNHPRHHPAWYGAVMGTGAVALALDSAPTLTPHPALSEESS